VQHSLFKPC